MDPSEKKPEELLPEDSFVVNSTTGRIIIPTKSEEITGAIKTVRKNPPPSPRSPGHPHQQSGQRNIPSSSQPQVTQSTEAPPVVVKQDQSFVIYILLAVFLLFLSGGLFMLFQEHLKLQKGLGALRQELTVFKSDVNAMQEIFKKDIEAMDGLNKDIDGLNATVLELTNAYNDLINQQTFVTEEQIEFEVVNPQPTDLPVGEENFQTIEPQLEEFVEPPIN